MPEEFLDAAREGADKLRARSTEGDVVGLVAVWGK
jgi:hypothetical protein